MKTLIASLVAIAAVSTAASAGGHGHRHHGHGHGHGHFHFKKHFHAPVYHAPVKCHFVYKHGYRTRVCHKVY